MMSRALSVAGVVMENEMKHPSSKESVFLACPKSIRDPELSLQERLALPDLQLLHDLP